LECHSIRAALRTLERHRPRVFVVRRRLDDGFSDDLLMHLQRRGPGAVRTIVLLEAGEGPRVEARQISLGADCAMRDPIRTEVFLAYAGQYVKRNAHTAIQPPGHRPRPEVTFCGGLFSSLDRTFRHGEKAVVLSPRESSLVELLVQSAGGVASYEYLYGEILGRRFCGDTSNMRVLLGKLSISCRRVDISIRPFIEVIPKSGYRYAGSKAANRLI